MTSGPVEGLTIRDLVLQALGEIRALDSKLDGYIAAHGATHAAADVMAANAMANPSATPAGQAVIRQLDELQEKVANHDRTMWRLQGAGAVVTFLGVGGLATGIVALLRAYGGL